MRVLFVGWRYQHIYISTGPDSEHYTNIVNVLFFFLCCLFYGHKITMTLRNTKPYLESDPGIYSFIRSRAIRHVRRFTFETATMRDIFIALTERRNVLSGVSYDKYPDVPIDGVEVAPQPDVSGKRELGCWGPSMRSVGTTNLSLQHLNVSRMTSESPFVLRLSDNVTVVHSIRRC